MNKLKNYTITTLIIAIAMISTPPPADAQGVVEQIVDIITPEPTPSDSIPSPSPSESTPEPTSTPTTPPVTPTPTIAATPTPTPITPFPTGQTTPAPTITTTPIPSTKPTATSSATPTPVIAQGGSTNNDQSNNTSGTPTPTTTPTTAPVTTQLNQTVQQIKSKVSNPQNILDAAYYSIVQAPNISLEQEESDKSQVQSYYSDSRLSPSATRRNIYLGVVGIILGVFIMLMPSPQWNISPVMTYLRSRTKQVWRIKP